MDWTSQKIILASQSPRRQEILEMVGLKFTVQKSEYEEDRIIDKTPMELVETHAIEKAKDVATTKKQGLVIGSDTIVVIDHEILEKPQNKSHAFDMLKKLSGRTHEVQTGVAVINAVNSKTLSFVEITEVTFFPLSDDMINHYLKNYEYADKAGSYAIQDYSGLFVEKIHGCFYNVVGFPVARFFNFLNKNQHKLL
ncbi:MAG: septum formation protein Maf [Candidatus Marinimicrobia bacterium]|nr:septum formation protein Maf [Candidatus Neomarinimicrobiota bacterium]